MSDLHIAPDHATLIADTAVRIQASSVAAIAVRGVFHWALSGGSTPKALFQLLATPAWASQFDWANIHLWWSDERDVAQDAPDSNYKMAADALIKYVSIPTANIHRVQTELGAGQAALLYERAVVEIVGEGVKGAGDEATLHPPTSSPSHPLTPSATPPSLDLILLGMGDDGHTASLFPGTAAILEQERLVIAHFVPKVNMMRMTFTPVLINAARTVMFLVSGASKALILRRVLYEMDQPNVLPSQIVSPASGDLVWMIDVDAAAKLGETDGLGEGSLEDIYRRQGLAKK